MAIPSLSELLRLEVDSASLEQIKIRRGRAERASREVAIIGMSGQVGSASTLEEFWQRLLLGEDGYGPLAESRRRDADEYLAARGVKLPIDPARYVGGTRLPNVAEFDYQFFGLSAVEARLMDPHQRLFLQAAWAALEDAGHLGKDLRGSTVGVFAGMSSDFGVDYRGIVEAIAPNAPEVSVVGNVKSMIASRLSYLLDLRGPSMLVDTACSSGLVAIFTAIRALQSGSCTMAIVGAVNCDLLPVAANGEGPGIRDIMDTAAADRTTRTFDRRCDGTVAAEGAIAFVLKPLEASLRDRDHVRAVIVGGAINQDGASNGITAPNADAQGRLIREALTDACVDADQISYIEAHGTATRLGDPIEVGGIQRAFSADTDRLQFCAIGTVKSNIGHMDNASGLVGLAKLVLSLEHRMLPAIRNFEEPNPNIDFAHSPLYVNDRVAPWGDADEMLYAGINSFGLSGTNCHLVVRSADLVPQGRPCDAAVHLLPISAKRPDALRLLAEGYIRRLKDASLECADIAFTASVGRLHHPFRTAVIYGSREELIDGLRALAAGEGRPNVLIMGEDGNSDVLSTDAQQETDALCLRTVNDRVGLQRLGELYCMGTDVAWSQLYANADCSRVALPTYPFAEVRCWVQPSKQRPTGLVGIAELLTSREVDILAVRLSPSVQWELDEHRIQGVCVLPGTGLVELMMQTLIRTTGREGIALEQIVFLTPLAIEDGEERQVHVVFHRDTQDLVVSSQLADGTWIDHATASASVAGGWDCALDIAAIQGRLQRKLDASVDLDVAKGLALSPRWNNAFVAGWADESASELLLEFALPPEFRGEVDDYLAHPALLDAAINAPTNLYGAETLYLPLSCGRMEIGQPLPSRIVAHFIARPESVQRQVQVFDVTITDPDGGVLLTAEKYCLKAATALDLSHDEGYGYVETSSPVDSVAPEPGTGPVLVHGFFEEEGRALGEALQRLGYTPTVTGGDPMIDTPSNFVFGMLASDGKNGDFTGPAVVIADFLRRIVDEGWNFERGLLGVTRSALGSGVAEATNPAQAAVLGVLRVGALEYRSLGLRCIDVDVIDPDTLIGEATDRARHSIVRVRGGRRSVPILERCSLRRGTNGSELEAGVILISGGTGALGMAVAEHLAGRGADRLVLLGSPDGHDDVAKIAQLRSKVKVLEVHRPDLADAVALSRLTSDIRARLGRIQGVMHLAGRPSAGFLYDSSIETFTDVFLPKVEGARHLEVATAEDDLDFFIAFSSIAGLLLNSGQAHYTAANLALDSLATARRAAGRPWISLQWPAWREIGIARRLGAVDETEEISPLDTEEALSLLDAVLGNLTLPPVLTPGRRSMTQAGMSLTKPRGTDQPAAQVQLFGGTGDDVESSVAQAWAETLDLTELDVADDFAEHGGNSLLTAHLLKALERRFPGQLDITDLFRYTTVAAQASALRERLGLPTVGEASQPGRGDDMESILDALEQGHITVEQSSWLL